MEGRRARGLCLGQNLKALQPPRVQGEQKGEYSRIREEFDDFEGRSLLKLEKWPLISNVCMQMCKRGGNDQNADGRKERPERVKEKKIRGEESEVRGKRRGPGS